MSRCHPPCVQIFSRHSMQTLSGLCRHFPILQTIARKFPILVLCSHQLIRKMFLDLRVRIGRYISNYWLHLCGVHIFFNESFHNVFPHNALLPDDKRAVLARAQFALSAPAVLAVSPSQRRRSLHTLGPPLPPPRRPCLLPGSRLRSLPMGVPWAVRDVG